MIDITNMLNALDIEIRDSPQSLEHAHLLLFKTQIYTDLRRFIVIPKIINHQITQIYTREG